MRRAFPCPASYAGSRKKACAEPDTGERLQKTSGGIFQGTSFEKAFLRLCPHFSGGKSADTSKKEKENEKHEV